MLSVNECVDVNLLLGCLVSLMEEERPIKFEKYVDFLKYFFSEIPNDEIEKIILVDVPNKCDVFNECIEIWYKSINETCEEQVKELMVCESISLFEAMEIVNCCLFESGVELFIKSLWFYLGFEKIFT